MTYAEAVAAGAKRYFTGKACVHGHVCERYVSNRRCIQCIRDNTTPEMRRKAVAKWRQQNPGHREAVAATQRIRKRYPDAIPEGFQVKDVVSFYREAKERTQATGVKYEVDHDIPLSQGGLHTWWNLSVVTRTYNRKKGKRLQETENSLDWMQGGAQ